MIIIMMMIKKNEQQDDVTESDDDQLDEESALLAESAQKVQMLMVDSDSDSDSDSDDDSSLTGPPVDIEAKIAANKQKKTVPDRFADDPRFQDPAAKHNALLAQIRTGTTLNAVKTNDDDDGDDGDGVATSTAVIEEDAIDFDSEDELVMYGADGEALEPDDIADIAALSDSDDDDDDDEE